MNNITKSSFKNAYTLLETRKFIKTSPSDIVDQYKNDPKIYLSYINFYKDSPKIGINPKSYYNTPLGVYCYPLKELWRNLENSLENVPYGGGNPFIAIIKEHRGIKFVEDMYTDYKLSDYDKDMHELYNYFVNNNKIFTKEEFNKIKKFGTTEAKDFTPIMYMWLTTRTFAIALNNRNILKTANIDVDVLHSDHIRGSLNKTSLRWNRILHKVLGYDGFADKTGHGYIHPSEPTQAVFLSPVAYEVIDIVKNDSSKNKKTRNVSLYKNRKNLEYVLNSDKELKNLENNPDLLLDIILNLTNNFTSNFNAVPDKLYELFNEQSIFFINLITHYIDNSDNPDFKNFPKIVKKHLKNLSSYSIPPILTRMIEKLDSNITRLPKDVIEIMIENLHTSRGVYDTADGIHRETRLSIQDINKHFKSLYNKILDLPSNYFIDLLRKYCNNLNTIIDFNDLPKEFKERFSNLDDDSVYELLNDITRGFRYITNLPPEILEKIYKNEQILYTIALDKLNHGETIPENVLNGVTDSVKYKNDVTYCYINTKLQTNELACFDDLKIIPKQIYNVILNTPIIAYYLVARIIIRVNAGNRWEVEIPKDLLNAITYDPAQALKLLYFMIGENFIQASSILEKLPKQIYNSIINNDNTATQFFDSILVKQFLKVNPYYKKLFNGIEPTQSNLPPNSDNTNNTNNTNWETSVDEQGTSNQWELESFLMESYLKELKN